MADRTVTYRLQADIAQFRAQMAQASASVQKTAHDMTALDKNGAKMRQGLTSLGSAAGKVGLVAAAGLGAAVLSAAKFDSAMSGVQAATHESAQNMDLLRDAALRAGADTVYSASEAAGAIEALAKAGVSTQDILGGGLSGALDLAAAGSMDVAAAAEAAATAMTQFGLQGQDVPHVADLLAAAAGKAQGEVADFSMALNQSGLVAAQMGLSIEETTGSLAAFASAGLIGSDAGTSLKTMLLRLANPSTEAAEALDRFGISAYDAQGNMLPMADLAGQLAVAFKDQDQATRDAALATIFGSDAIRAANVLYNEGAKGIKDWTAAVDDQGYAAETAATKLDNLKGDWEAFTGSLETALIGVGDKQQGFFRSIVQGATDVTNAFNGLPDAAKGVTASLLGITAVTGGGFWLGAKVITGISETRQALEQLGPSGAKAAGALRSVSIAAAGLLALNAASDAVNAMFKSMDGAAPSVERLTRNLENLGEGKSKWTALSIRAISEEVGNLGDLLDTTDSKFAGSLQQTTDWLGKIPMVGDMAANQIENLDAVTTRSLVGWREADATIQSLDQSLMQIASSAGPGGAEKAFTQLARAQGLSADQQAQLMAMLPAFGDLMRDTGRAGEEAGAGTSFFGRAAADVLGVLPGLGDGTRRGTEGVRGLGDAARDAAGDVQTLKGALEALNGLLDKRQAMRNYLDSFDALKETVKEFGPGSREAAQGFDDMARGIGVVASHMKGAARTEFLTRATKDLKAFGTELKLPPKLMQPVLDMLHELARTSAKPKVEPEGIPETERELNRVKDQMRVTDALKAVPVVGANIGAALSAILQVRASLNAIPDEQVNVYINRIGTSSTFGGRATNGADGMTVPGPRQPYGDKILAYLAPGEEVISNRFGQADRNRELLQAINANRYADGTPGVRGGAGFYIDAMKADLALHTFARTAAKATDTAEESEQSEERREKAEERREKAREASARRREKAEEILRGEIDETRTSMQALQQRFAEMRDAVASNFLSNDPLYGEIPEGSSQTPASLFLLQLRNQRAQANAFRTELEQLRALGLDGGLFAHVAQSGDFALASSFADMSRGQIRQAEQLWAQRQRAAMGVGRFAADEQLGARLDAVKGELQTMVKEFRDLKDPKRGIAINAHTIDAIGEAFGEEVADEIRDIGRRAGRANK